MKVEFDCIPCTVQSCLRLFEAGVVDESRREELLRRTLGFLAETDWRQSPPSLAQHLHRLVRESLGDDDPYREIKRAGNAMMLERLDGFRATVAASPDPLGTAIRLAVAGNVIDFGAKRLYDPAETVAAVLDAELAVDDVEALKERLSNARDVLYVGDNAGEIVVDALLLETLAHPDATFVVRGAPVINDALLEDARLVGVDRHARLLTTGDDAPGVILESSSDEFRAAYADADVVVAKGQGNLEGLIDEEREVFFLLTVKCARIGERLGVGEGGFVVWRKPPGRAWTAPGA